MVGFKKCRQLTVDITLNSIPGINSTRAVFCIGCKFCACDTMLTSSFTLATKIVGVKGVK